MVDGCFERRELRAYLTQLLCDFQSNLESAQGCIADEGVSNTGVVECLTEMREVAREMAEKVKNDVRLKNLRSCEECFEQFNDDGRAERFCSDGCREQYDRELEQEPGREDDCS